MRNMLVTSAMLASLSSTAIAQELKDDVIKLAANVVSYKFTVCAALQGYNSMCLANQDSALKAKSEEAKKDFLDIALSTATVAGVKIPDIVVTRYRIALKDFQRQTDHNCQNISVLFGRYAAPCKALIQNPEAVLKFHLAKARQIVERSKENPKPPPTAVLPKSSTTTTPEPRAWSPTSQEFKNAVDVEDIKQHSTAGTKSNLRGDDGGGSNGGAAGNGGGQGAQEAGGKDLSSGKVNAADRGNSAAAHAAKADPKHPSALGASNGEAARLNANAKSAAGKIYKTYADKLTAYLGLDPAATESARTAALAKLAAALADASKIPVSVEVVSAINTRLAEQDPALANALASADPTLNQSIADTASALSRTGGEQEAVDESTAPN